MIRIKFNNIKMKFKKIKNKLKKHQIKNQNKNINSMTNHKKRTKVKKIYKHQEILSNNNKNKIKLENR